MAQAAANTLMAVHRVMPKFLRMDKTKSNIMNMTKNSTMSHSTRYSQIVLNLKNCVHYL